MNKRNEFFTEFEYIPILGGYQEGITRRDPSPVIKVDNLYYCWYSRSTHNSSGYYAEIWYAVSSDGFKWKEMGKAVGKGSNSNWDENGVFTPSVLIAEDRYYIFYTAVPKPFTQEHPPTQTAIGIATAESPHGPWTKFVNNPVLNTGKPDEWDSCRVDDSCLIVRNGKYWLYYKGRQMGLSPAETKMGLAISEFPQGPYRKHPQNPILKSGHEVCVWPHGEGVAAIIAPTGPEGSTIQYSPDGINFSVKAKIKPPSAPGPYRTDEYKDVEYGKGITWGICQNIHEKTHWPFLMRFDCHLKAEKQRYC
ncbi:family 43 glycosylhydrolase [Candidatus Poribacteria bacterium]|nr:family 43 glycosylhydrolase [Candidatus Poribacteria bacterium]